jgi:outer membrane protein assembly factor BamB
VIETKEGRNMRRLVVLVLLMTTLGVVASSELTAEFEVAPRLVSDGDWPMWGSTLTRNMVSDATGLPAEWDTDTGLNVKWVAALGSASYGNPVVADGKIFIGTNNELMRAPDVAGDKGIVMAFRESDGEFLWQMVHDKLESGQVNDWPFQGICSSPTVDGDRLYYVSNRGEVVALDTEGFLDGENDGLFTDEVRAGEVDGDVVWSFDMIGQLDVFPHNMTSSSPAVYEDLVIVNTSNGRDEEGHLPSPHAPDLIALDKHTGELVWRASPLGEQILHGQWSSPAVAEIDGGRLHAIDATQRGNVTESGLVWRVEEIRRSLSTAAIHDGLLYLADFSGFFRCFDVSTGEEVWMYDTFAAVWGSPLVADNKVYLGDEDGDVIVLRAGREMEELAEMNLGNAVYGAPVVANSVLYINTRSQLYALVQQ